MVRLTGATAKQNVCAVLSPVTFPTQNILRLLRRSLHFGLFFLLLLDIPEFDDLIRQRLSPYAPVSSMHRTD